MSWPDVRSVAQALVNHPTANRARLSLYVANDRGETFLTRGILLGRPISASPHLSIHFGFHWVLRGFRDTWVYGDFGFDVNCWHHPRVLIYRSFDPLHARLFITSIHHGHILYLLTLSV